MDNDVYSLGRCPEILLLLYILNISKLSLFLLAGGFQIDIFL